MKRRTIVDDILIMLEIAKRNYNNIDSRRVSNNSRRYRCAAGHNSCIYVLTKKEI